MKPPEHVQNPVPSLRGKVHIPIFGIYFLLVFMLFKYKCNLSYKLACYVYLLCTLFILTTVTVLHNNYWSKRNRSLLRRLDYAAIFLMIGGSGFPCAIHYLFNSKMVIMVLTHWSIILFGAFGSILFNFTCTPKWFRSIIYSLASTPYFFYPYFTATMKMYKECALMLSIAFFYITGSVFYALGKPNLIPGVFESHELFHLFCCFGFMSSLSVNYIYLEYNKV
ncbi:hypothetical protein MACK_004092 [Theileria orientalis]|uniref:Hemolysin III n=1 Tax=Theileria orientalis TaxID=68886 RepID=A0A976XI69_THEOR|nr:hypothetical protein MACK_004092 [Theileria orientalis]